MSPDTFLVLRRDLADRDVLTVFINAEEHDPTQRTSWRLRLKNGLDAQQQAVAPEQADAFAAARSAVEAELKKYTGFLPGRSWVLYASADGIHHVSREAVPLADLVRWQRGPVLGPLTRALRQDRSVVVAVIDSLRARLFEYRDGELEEQIDHRADAFIDDLTDRHMSKRAATTTGMRGVTATDEADRILRLELERHARQVASTILSRGKDAIVIAGGPTLAVTELRRLLEPALGTRLHVDDALHMAMTPAQLLGPVEDAASQVTRRLQEAVVRQLLEAAAPGAAVSVGTGETGRAGGLGQVERLYVTAAALGGVGADVEELIGQVLDHGGGVELLSGAAAELVDESAAGVVARLRYAPAPAVQASSAGVTQRA